MSTRNNTEGPSLPDAAAPATSAQAASADMPKPVVDAMKVVAAMKPAHSDEAPLAALDDVVAAASRGEAAAQPRSNRFALLAASVALAGALGGTAGALGTSLLPRQEPSAALAALDLTPLQDTMASLRAEIAAIKTSVETSNRNAQAQLTKLSERIDRVAQATPSAQRAQAPSPTTGQAVASTNVTGSVRAQSASAEPRPRVIDGWVVRHVSRGVAIIQGRMGAIEVEAGDIVPGVGRIESIRRQDGRWVVLTSNGMIRSTTTTR